MAWERFRCNVDCKTFPDTCIGEKLFLEQGERLAKDGMVFTLGKNINTDKPERSVRTACRRSEWTDRPPMTGRISHLTQLRFIVTKLSQLNIIMPRDIKQ